MPVIRLIATDLDDTLLNASGDVNPRVLEALKAVMARGCGVTLSSGRMLEAMERLAAHIGVNAPMLLYNGAMAYDFARQKTLFADQIPYETALQIARLCEDAGYYIQAYPGKGYYCPRITDATRRYAASIRVEPICVNRPIAEWMQENPSGMQKLLLVDTVEGADRAQDMLRQAFGDTATFAKSRPHYVEVSPKGVDKGRALERLYRLLGLERREVMVFGDGQNDVTMIAAAGTGVCMENGCPQAKAAATRIAPSNLEDGVAVVLEEYMAEGKIAAL